MRALAVALTFSLAAVPQEAPRTPAVTTYPFQVGERLQFAAKLGILRLGTGWMSVNGIDTVRGAGLRVRVRPMPRRHL
jgi:hypothetical protein